jgi:hypothetical protein
MMKAPNLVTSLCRVSQHPFCRHQWARSVWGPTTFTILQKGTTVGGGERPIPAANPNPSGQNRSIRHRKCLTSKSGARVWNPTCEHTEIGLEHYIQHPWPEKPPNTQITSTPFLLALGTNAPATWPYQLQLPKDQDCQTQKVYTNQ